MSYTRYLDQEFDNYVCEAGFKLNGLYTNDNVNGYQINCPMYLHHAYKVFKSIGEEDTFKDALIFNKNIFHGDPISLKRDFLSGIFIFYLSYKDDIDKEYAIYVFSKYSAEAIRDKAYIYYVLKNRNEQFQLCMSKALIDIYNESIRKLQPLIEIEDKKDVEYARNKY